MICSGLVEAWEGFLTSFCSGCLLEIWRIEGKIDLEVEENEGLIVHLAVLRRERLANDMVFVGVGVGRARKDSNLTRTFGFWVDMFGHPNLEIYTRNAFVVGWYEARWVLKEKERERILKEVERWNCEESLRKSKSPFASRRFQNDKQQITREGVTKELSEVLVGELDRPPIFKISWRLAIWRRTNRKETRRRKREVTDCEGQVRHFAATERKLYNSRSTRSFPQRPPILRCWFKVKMVIRWSYP